MAPMSLKVKAEVLTMTLRPYIICCPHLQSAVWPQLDYFLFCSLCFSHTDFVLLPLTHQTQSLLKVFALAAPSVQNTPILAASTPSLLSGLNLNISVRASCPYYLICNPLSNTSKPPPSVDWQDGGEGGKALYTVPRLMFWHHVATQSETCDLGCQRREKRAQGKESSEVAPWLLPAWTYKGHISISLPSTSQFHLIEKGLENADSFFFSCCITFH